ncbi:4-hydroxythreonine-4-phosphate dehydrogenase 1 [invertebrate metagenome]|uniref:4-hydroxythreonine-4-phosphate dehydrogenase 1 n=1 Tax=invertebrate metagenome TaxID=1711999 RepID=A0A2H9T682_9ZZZZ
MVRPVRLVVTTGEPAGIGPDICLQLLRDGFYSNKTAYGRIKNNLTSESPWEKLGQEEAILSWEPVQIVLAGDPQCLEMRARQLDIDVSLITFEPSDYRIPSLGEILVAPVPLVDSCQAGILNKANSPSVLNMLDYAVAGCQNGLFDAMVTGPVHKGIIHSLSPGFSGHTEYLAQVTNTPNVVMMFVSPVIKLALVTTHIPLSGVPDAITPDRLRRVLQILHRDLTRWFGVRHPHIRVCGLNPHAGEEGVLGREEITTIIPVIEQLRREGMNLSGPVPADTAFIGLNSGEHHCVEKADAVLAMYHDQGLPVLKYSGFETAVNITLGLPVIRTSVDHGTALDLAGTGRACKGSLSAAIFQAVRMVQAANRLER